MTEKSTYVVSIYKKKKVVKRMSEVIGQLAWHICRFRKEYIENSDRKIFTR